PPCADALLGCGGPADVGRPGFVPGGGVLAFGLVDVGAAAAVPVEQERCLAVAHPLRVAARAVGEADEVLPQRLGRLHQPLPAVPVLLPALAAGAERVAAVGDLLVVLVEQAADRRRQLPPPGDRVRAVVAGRVAGDVA